MARKGWFRIRTTADECWCDNCGEPLRVGDEALEGRRGVYCCDGCQEEGDGHDDSCGGLCAGPGWGEPEEWDVVGGL